MRTQGFAIEPRQLSRLRAACKKRDIKLSAAAREAFDLWLSIFAADVDNTSTVPTEEVDNRIAQDYQHDPEWEELLRLEAEDGLFIEI